MFHMPVIRVLVVCGLLVTEAIFSPTMAFKSEDFPALVRPAIVTKAVFGISYYLPER